MTALAVSPDGQLLASGVGGRHATAVEIGFWNLRTHAQAGSFKGSSASMGALVFSPDGDTIYCGRLDGAIEQWNLRTRQLEHVMKDVAPVEYLAIRPDGTTLLSAGGRGPGVRVFDLNARKQVRTLGGKTVISMALSAVGDTLAIGECPLRVALIDLEDRRPTRVFTPEGESWRAVDRVALSNDGKLMVTATDAGRIEWWDVETGQSRGAIRAHLSFTREAEAILSMAFSPDGTSLATSGADGTIRLWEARTHRQVTMLAEKSLFALWAGAELRTEPCCLVFTPSGDALASGHDDRMIRLWDSPPRYQTRGAGS